MQKQKESLSASMAKLIMVLSLIVGIGSIIGVLGYYLTKQNFIISPAPITISAIEISVDKKSILNAETGEVIFTIDDANRYLKDSGYLYNPDTFQNTNAKYAGDCFLDASLSNNKNKIVFSSGCLAGDLPQTWMGIYNSPILCPHMPNIDCAPNPPPFKFLIAGSGRNFVWSADDKTITYEAELGLSGMTETRTIDAGTGEVLERKNNTEIENSETKDWQTYRNEKYGFEVKYPEDWHEKESPYDDTGVLFLNTDKEIIIGGAAPDDFYSADGKEINPKYSNDWMGIQIDAYFKPVNFSWDNWIKNNNFPIEKYESYNYEGLEGIKVTELNGLFYGEPNVFIEGKKIYNIRLYNDYPYNTERDAKRDDLALNYFNQILSTFKFTESN